MTTRSSAWQKAVRRAIITTWTRRSQSVSRSLPSEDRLAWRHELLREKLGGRFPCAAWVEIVRLLLPKRVCAHPLRATIAASDGPTGRILWRTAAGSVWGHDRDRECLELIATEQLLSIYQQGPVRVRRETWCWTSVVTSVSLLTPRSAPAQHRWSCLSPIHATAPALKPPRNRDRAHDCARRTCGRLAQRWCRRSGPWQYHAGWLACLAG